MSHVGGRALSGCTPIQTLLTRRKLVEMKRKAIRSGVWFTALNRTERAYIDLTVKVVDRVRSLLLTKVLTAVMKKLLDATENKVAHLMREVGCKLASKISRIARVWGNPHATEWATDLRFIRYLTIINTNTTEAHET